MTRVFDSRRTPQDAFVRAILNSENADKAEKCLQEVGCEGIIENEGNHFAVHQILPEKEKRMGRTTYKTAPKGGLYTRLSVDDGITDRESNSITSQKQMLTQFRTVPRDRGRGNLRR